MQSAVSYILAVPYHVLFRQGRPSGVDSDQLLFPAFDSAQALVGFYVELKDARNATIIHFLPLDPARSAQLSVKPSTAHDLLHLLVQWEEGEARVREESLAALGIPPSFTAELLLQALYVLKKHRDLETMKQDALVHYWLSQVAFDDF